MTSRDGSDIERKDHDRKAKRGGDREHTSHVGFDLEVLVIDEELTSGRDGTAPKVHEHGHREELCEDSPEQLSGGLDPLKVQTILHGIEDVNLHFHYFSPLEPQLHESYSLYFSTLLRGICVPS